MRGFAIGLYVIALALLILVVGSPAIHPESSASPPPTAARVIHHNELTTRPGPELPPSLAEVRAEEAAEDPAPPGVIYVEDLPLYPPPQAADPFTGGGLGSNARRMTNRPSVVRNASRHKRAHPMSVNTGGSNVTGINHWWTYEEDGIPGVGRYMVN